MLITAATSAPAAQAATPKVAESEAKPTRERDAAPQARANSTSRARANSTPPPERASEYRLVYDKEFSRTFVQIVDRDSGEEILRFPPEELIRFINNTIERNEAGRTAGLLIDRSV